MMVVVTGGSGSGKSAYAESLFQDFSGEKIYIATMQVYDEEGKAKVARHRKLREGKGFLTVESQRNVGELFEAATFPDMKDTLPDENTLPDAKNPQNEKAHFSSVYPILRRMKCSGKMGSWPVNRWLTRS